jgi:eukaryotic-like serine/threonine-protein kinase
MLSSQLSLLEAQGLVSLAAADPELEYAFSHTLLHEAAYSSLTYADRRDLHQAVGAALESLYPERLDELAPRLADHFFFAGDYPRAVQYYLSAGRAAQRAYANPEAVMHYRHALKLIRLSPPEPGDEALLVELCRRLGRVLELSGRYTEALAHYQEMEADARASGSRPLELAALLARGTVQSIPTILHDPGAAREASERALVLSRELGDRAAESKALWNHLLLYAFTDQLDAALRFGEQSLEIARALGLKEQIAYTLNDITSYVHIARGDTAISEEMLTEARQIWEELNNIPMLADTLSNLGFNRFIAGDYERSLEWTGEAYRISASINNLWGMAYSQGIRSLIFSHRGLADQALPSIDQALVFGKQAGFIALQNITYALKAGLYGMFGSPQAGILIARQGIEIGRQVYSVWQPIAYASLAYLQALSGQTDEARASLQASGRTGLEADIVLLTSLYTQAVSEIYLARGEYTALLEFLDDYLARLEEHATGGFQPTGKYYRGAALFQGGRLPEAMRVLADAARLADQYGVIPMCWRARALLAQISAAQGDADAAHRWRSEARQAALELAGHAGSPDLKASFLALPEVQRVLEGTSP